MTWDRTAPLIAEHGPGYPFEGTAQILRAADLTVGNLEGPVVSVAETRKGKYRYRVPPSTIQGLVETGGFDLVSLANNHVTDCGRAGLSETISNLAARGVEAFGAGADRRSAQRPAIRQVGDAKVAFLGFLAPETHVLEVEELDKPGRAARVEKKLRANMGVGDKKGGAVVASQKKVAELVREAR